MFGQSGLDGHVGDHIAGHKEEVADDEVAFVEVAEGIADGGGGRAEEGEGAEG